MFEGMAGVTAAKLDRGRLRLRRFDFIPCEVIQCERQIKYKLEEICLQMIH